MSDQDEWISSDQLQIGLYVRLDSWMNHPFLFNAFKIRDEKQLAALRSLGVERFHYVSSKSDCPPLPPRQDPVPAPPSPAKPVRDPALEAMWREKRRRREKVARRRAAVTQCEHHFQQGVAAFKSMLGSLFSRPQESVASAHELVGGMVNTLLAEKDALIHLVSIKEGDESAQYHALNVTVLALLLAREAGLPALEMRALGLGTLLHDIGKSEIPGKILLKRTPWTPAEQKFYEEHVHFGLAMARRLPDLPIGVLEVIGQHHEMLDGSGYPKGLKGGEIGPLARIAAIANAYDNYCNRLNPEDSMTPAEALAHMFKHQRHQFDEKLLQTFIKCLGVYPPGSIVQLNNDAIGMVTGASGHNLLQPTILLYDPAIPKDEAVFFDLDDEPELKVTRTLRPGLLPQEIYDYLNPRSRVSYTVEPGQSSR